MKGNKLIKLISTGTLIFINLLFSACTTTSGLSGKSVPVEDRSVTNTRSKDTATEYESTASDINAEVDIVIEDSRREKSITEQSSSPVALAFLKDADKYTTAGDSDRAVASLERGLDIEPKNPWLWNRLAAERLKQKMWVKAITLAKKSNAFVSGHHQLQKDNWQIIVEARVALGDVEGAKKAKEMVWRFSREKT
jgi:predicted Zn-dependent protease